MKKVQDAAILYELLRPELLKQYYQKFEKSLSSDAFSGNSLHLYFSIYRQKLSHFSFDYRKTFLLFSIFFDVVEDGVNRILMQLNTIRRFLNVPIFSSKLWFQVFHLHFFFIPDLLEYGRTCKFNPVAEARKILDRDFASEVHKRGINFRHLGRLFACLEDRNAACVCFVEMVTSFCFQ